MRSSEVTARIGGAHIESRGGEGAAVVKMAERPEATLEIADVDRDLGVDTQRREECGTVMV